MELIKVFSLFFTLYGAYLCITGDLTNGFLAMILGEVIVMPKT